MSAGDTVLSKAFELTYELKVGEAMTTDPVTISSACLMADLRTILRDRRISGMPVVDDGRLVGIVSLEDFITCLLERRPDCTVGERMTSAVQTVYADEPLVRAIDKFNKYRYGRFPVVDRATGRVMGIITKGDVIRCLLGKMETAFHQKEQKASAGVAPMGGIRADSASLDVRWTVVGQQLPLSGRCSSELKQDLLRLGFHPVVARRVGIATFEAEMNLAIFTSGGTIAALVTGEVVRVTVADAGPGIADIERAMQPGYSTAPDWVRELGFGAGMGLQNIKLHTDDLRIESEVGKGTTLTFAVRCGNQP